MDEESNFTKLDDTWIRQFEDIDTMYKDFYKDDIYYIHLQFIYINKNNQINKIQKDILLLNKPNYISNEELIGILKKATSENEIQYTLVSIVKYNIDLHPDEINNYLANNDTNEYVTNYISVVTTIGAIHLKPTIHMFHDLNDIIFIFYEK